MRRRFLSSNQRPVRYMTVEPLENGVYLSFGGNGLYYSIDDSDWISLPMDTNTPSINVGQTIKIKGLNIRTDSFYTHFSINGRCKLSGTIMSIIYGDKPYEEKVPLAGCFAGAFYDCTSIVEVAPDFLPATTLAHSCYYAMFFGCSSLTIAPELPATTLTEDCYNSMFAGCSKLNYIKMLATDISAPDCLYNWVSGVASTGIFVKNPAMTSLPTAALSNQYAGIPSGWTVVNNEDSDNGLTLPIRLYEGQNYASICSYIMRNWGYLMDEDGFVICSEHPDIFPDLENIIHINDEYYCTGFIIFADGSISLIPTEIYYMGTHENDYDILSAYLQPDGFFYIEWD